MQKCRRSSEKLRAAQMAVIILSSEIRDIRDCVTIKVKANEIKVEGLSGSSTETPSKPISTSNLSLRSPPAKRILGWRPGSAPARSAPPSAPPRASLSHVRTFTSLRTSASDPFQKMDSVDLTLTLRLPSAEDDHNNDDHPQVFQHPQFPQLVNAPGSPNLTQRFGYGASGNVHAGQNSGMSIIDFQRSVSVSQRRQSVFPHPTKMKEYCVINISNHKVNVGGARKRTTTHCRRPVRKPDNQNRICTNFNCRVSETPMWRRGPLGPKTLCNACGIKYRKLKLKEEQGEDREVSAGEGSSN